jgi:DNA replication protein DnaC
MSKEPPRIGEAATIGEIVDIPLPSLTEEQWAAREADLAARAETEARAAAELRSRHRRAKLRAAGFPERAIDYAMVADETASSIVRVRAWDPGKESVLVISGSRGCGKTVAATWWAMQRDPVPMFTRAASFAASSRYDRGPRDALLAARALVLDDLGTEFLDSKGSFLVDLDELIDVFYGDYKPLLITTNATLDTFRSRVGERITDRIRECGAFWSTRDESRRGGR